MSTTMAAVYAVGTVNADFTVCVDGAFAPGADIVARRLLRGSGGRGANVAVAARRLGARARLFGCVGDDDLAQQALEGRERRVWTLAACAGRTVPRASPR
jgi:ribokinase